MIWLAVVVAVEPWFVVLVVVVLKYAKYIYM